MLAACNIFTNLFCTVPRSDSPWLVWGPPIVTCVVFYACWCRFTTQPTTRPHIRTQKDRDAMGPHLGPTRPFVKAWRNRNASKKKVIRVCSRLAEKDLIPGVNGG
ncbi:metastasis-associated protein MTA3 [Anopheles sinensis]|uniref:Metastasis-associated protein MTA3 n=1 Tax=Anopheles sinensis TaxID=74873 RepID=A0A084WDQ8_ANOSI|nr:metastasis-associated protein MTA3 [Anopheles sinensis]